MITLWSMLKALAKIEARIAEIEADERGLPPAATCEVNPPLALIQLALETERETLLRVRAWLDEEAWLNEVGGILPHAG